MNPVVLKLILLLSLVSNILSYGVMIRPYVKDPFIERDHRAMNAYNLVTKKVLGKDDESSKALMYPVVIYRQINNGVNYKIITAVKDEKNKKVNFVDSTVYTGPFTNNESTEETTIITHLEKLSDSYNTPDEGLILEIGDFIYRNRRDGEKILSIDSIVTVPNVIENEKFYLAHASIEIKDNILSRYYIIYQEVKRGIYILQIFNFQE